MSKHTQETGNVPYFLSTLDLPILMPSISSNRIMDLGDPLPWRDAGRDRRWRRPAEPVEHPARLAGAELVFSTELTRTPLQNLELPAAL